MADDDLDEIKLTPDRDGGSAKRSRNARKRAIKALMETKKRPKWKRQLSALHKSRRSAR